MRVPNGADAFEDCIPGVLDPLPPFALAAACPQSTRRESATLT